MPTNLALLARLTVVATTLSAAGLLSAALRPPAVPLIVHDPYFSIWSMSDKLTDAPTQHWTGVNHSLTGLIRIDGKSYRFLGQSRRLNLPALEQTSLEVLPTRTIYHFRGAGINLAFTFLTPSLPHDLDVLSRPVTYLVWDATANDGAEHDCQVYFDASTDIAVNTPDEPTNWSRYRLGGGIEVLRAGSQQQPILQKSGDNVRIDWGYLYLVAPPDQHASLVATDRETTTTAFNASGALPDTDDLGIDTPQRFRTPVLAAGLSLGKVGATPVSRHLLIAYDDLYSIEYFHRWLKPYWARNGADAAWLLRTAVHDYPSLLARCEQFDKQLMADLRKTGGDQFAEVSALAYRQTIGAHKLTADIDGTPLFFSKENFSNGSIDTVDVTYPSSPFFLLFNVKLLEAQLRPILDYARLNGRWRFPFAPHDLGRYPIANGQRYGGGETSEENQMPVEESGNMLILIAAAAQVDGNANFAAPYWPLLTKWAVYLKEFGLDPANQLSTDDFTGHLARNTNLSVKAIEALGSYARIAKMLGKEDIAREYEKLAREYAVQWDKMAEGKDHYRLVFDNNDTWSQKYNLVWDKLLSLHLFPESLIQKESKYYLTKMNPYGLPLDNRADHTKLDWAVWTASLSGSRADFERHFAPLYRFVNESPSRVPLTDWYDTKTGKQRGFQARSVVGGIFIPMLYDETMWRKYQPLAPAAERSAAK